MAAQYSKDGKYFARLTTNGKLKLWETSTSSFVQEFTPDFHLTSPCTCLHFIHQESSENHVPRKKKRKNSLDLTEPVIALGTSSGKLLIYSIGKGDLDYAIDSKTNLPINCISWTDGAILYSAVDQNIISWNLEKRFIKNKWKAGNEIIKSILALPENKVITGARTIKLWNAVSQELLRTFTGHSQEVRFLNYVNPRNGNDSYVISGSKGDRLLSVWSLSEDTIEKNAIANFSMEDVPIYISTVTIDGVSTIAAVTHSGKAHIYQHTLNGKCSKPLKSKTILQVAQQNQSNTVALIPIVAAYVNDDKSLLIAHGNDVTLVFENVVVDDSQKLQVLVRDDPVTFKRNDKKVTKVQTPATDNVHYVTPHTSNAVKRKTDGRQEVPMEKRLENLTLNKLDSKSKIPRVNNVAQLLIQGLHSKDKTMLKSVLNSEHEESVIKNTIKRLPVPVVLPLIEELTSLIQGTTVPSQSGCIWLKHLLQIHSAIFLSNPELPSMLAPVLGCIESRLSLLMPLNRLRGRLDLLVSQVTTANAPNNEEDEDALLVYNDKGLSDSESEVIDFASQSESENEWNEDSDEESNVANDEDSDDVEMI
ncbi:hypothetical protein RN001_015081 [Aquatica leii]|uniref:Small-subunit processome Utp12 domain-containing protein n=1 Tax=Aquatica leii TaxID=1421715 RepID=A0AAN7PQ74_9COLE|nr:hypothetical protein RN001_015081 [Aquatica leii]